MCKRTYHPAEDEINERGDFIDQLRAEIRRDPTQRSGQVYDSIIIQQPAGAQYIPDFNSVRSLMGPVRRENVPPIPANINNVAFPGQWARTYNNEEYLVHQNNNLGVAVFATDTDLRLLAQASMVYVDGTFRTAPHPYTQFFTVHGHETCMWVAFSQECAVLKGSF